MVKTSHNKWELGRVVEFIGRKCCVMINLWWKSRKFTPGLFLRLSRYRQLSNNYSNLPFLIYCFVSCSIVFKSSRVSSQFTRLITERTFLQDCQSFWEVSWCLEEQLKFKNDPTHTSGVRQPEYCWFEVCWLVWYKNFPKNVKNRNMNEWTTWNASTKVCELTIVV